MAGLSSESVFRQVAQDFISVIDDPQQVRSALHS